VVIFIFFPNIIEEWMEQEHDPYRMYKLRCNKVRWREKTGNEKPFYTRVWCTDSQLSKVIAQSVANFNAYYGAHYEVTDVVAVVMEK
jgi:hypothetical protein